jgi:Tat protein secretion system quality control protein TatD with DNase activity
VLAAVAACRGEAPEVVAETTTRNALTFFSFEKYAVNY